MSKNDRHSSKTPGPKTVSTGKPSARNDTKPSKGTSVAPPPPSSEGENKK